MTRSLQAIYEKGVLRPLEPLLLEEQQQVTVTLSDESGEELLDAGFLSYLESQADNSITLEQVRAGLAKIPAGMTEDFRNERNERY